MTFYDIFNGDADGLCALHQIRLAEPCESTLITGVKRDIALLERPEIKAGAGDRVLVLDISLHENRAGLTRLLQAGAQCLYFDHHFAGDDFHTIAKHPNFRAFINTGAEVCTSLIVNDFLQGQYRAWAVTAAFGDNLFDAAHQAALPLELDDVRLSFLQKLGECLNYNAYGETVADLHYPPDELYQTLHRYTDPFDFIENEPVFEVLRNAYMDDLEAAVAVEAALHDAARALVILPDVAWARRINGVFSNHLAQQSPQRAHAVLVKKADGYSVSVRAPLARADGADALCRQFETGGGRKGAAGINHLPTTQLDEFVEKFTAAF